MGFMPLNDVESPRLLIELIEEKSKWLANHTFMRYPGKNWQLDGYSTLTWSQCADAIDKVAYWLDEQLGKSEDIDTVGYFGPADPRYAFMVPAIVKTNRKLLIPDGRVTKEGLSKLIDATKCTAWICTEEDDNSVRELGIKLKCCALPSLKWCLDNKDHRRYPYNKTFEEAKFDEVVIIHTSGTTGDPKPIYHTNGYYSAFRNVKSLSRKHWPKSLYSDAWHGKRMLSPAPPQWLGGLLVYILAPVFCDTSSVILPPDMTDLCPSDFKKILQLNMVDGIGAPPYTLHELYKDSEGRQLLKSLSFICYFGAALDRDVGNGLCHFTRLTSIIGATETGPQASFSPLDKNLWYTYDYVPENGYRMVQVPNSNSMQDGSDDLYELILERPADGQPNMYQSAFWNPQFKSVDIIETKELYAPIKDLDGRNRWIFSARKDDLMKLNWLAKFHAQDIEKRIEQHPDVAEVLVGGEGRPTPYVLIKAVRDVFDRKSAQALLNELYEGIVAKTNEKDFKEIQIPKETVIIAKNGKDFKKNSKMTLMRKAIEQDFMEEIDDAYEKLAKVGSI